MGGAWDMEVEGSHNGVAVPEHDATSRFLFPFFTTVIMDILHTQLNNIQRHLAFVAVTDINWKFYVQLFSWSVSLFESYLL